MHLESTTPNILHYAEYQSSKSDFLIFAHIKNILFIGDFTLVTSKLYISKPTKNLVLLSKWPNFVGSEKKKY